MRILHMFEVSQTSGEEIANYIEIASSGINSRAWSEEFVARRRYAEGERENGGREAGERGQCAQQ